MLSSYWTSLTVWLLSPSMKMFMNSTLAPAKLNPTLSRFRGSRGGKFASGIPVFMYCFRLPTTLINFIYHFKVFWLHFLSYSFKQSTVSLFSRHWLSSDTRSAPVKNIIFEIIKILSNMLARVHQVLKWFKIVWKWYDLYSNIITVTSLLASFFFSSPKD